MYLTTANLLVRGWACNSSRAHLSRNCKFVFVEALLND